MNARAEILERSLQRSSNDIGEEESVLDFIFQILFYLALFSCCHSACRRRRLLDRQEAARAQRFSQNEANEGGLSILQDHLRSRRQLRNNQSPRNTLTNAQVELALESIMKPTLMKSPTASHAAAAQDNTSSNDLQQEQSVRACPVCLDICEEGEWVVKCETCTYIFHKDCILKWLMRHNDCPNCRSVMFDRDDLKRSARLMFDNDEIEIPTINTIVIQNSNINRRQQEEV